MPLDKPTLKVDLLQILSDPQTSSNVQTVVDKLADAIEKYVKSGLVTGICGGAGQPLTQGKVT